MPLNIGARLGPYELLAVVGAGGMGEVYKARDTRLNRAVAIKILPALWASDPVMRQRFDVEAKVIAGLNHPNICTLHDAGHEDATESAPAVDYLVMEFVEGEPLSDRLEKGALPMREALTAAVGIADALDKAHRQGVVHRDLKPSNVMITKRGPKLLDFGLAKPGGALQSAGPAMADGRSMLPTAAGITTPGTIVGTVQYMAPEQLEGRVADARTDIFSFGVLLYEMLTGKKAFQGKSKTLLMSAILTSEPKPLTHAQPMSPAALDHLVRRCLAKDPEERWQTAHDLLVELRWVAGVGSKAVSEGAGVTRRTRVLRWLATGAVVTLAGLAFPAAILLWPPAPGEEIQYRSPAIGLSPTDIAISPDGTTIAFVARPNANEPSALYVRPTRSPSSRRVLGTDDATQPFWSPDSRSVAFVAGGKLKRVDALGGSPQDIATVKDVAGGTWNQDGTILFGSSAGVQRVSAEGGTPQAITTLDKGETGHLWPWFLPDGRRFLYLAWSAKPGTRGIVAGSIDGMLRTKVLPAESNPVYASPGYLVFHREASVFALPFDADDLRTSGDPFHLADGVGFSGANGRGNFAASQTGALLYFQGAGGPAGRGQTVGNALLGWIGAAGDVSPAGDVGNFGDFDLSVDGKVIAVTRQEPGAGADIWLIYWQRGGVAAPLTRDPADDINPVWSPDGERVAYTTYRKGNADVYVRDVSGIGAETPLVETQSDEFVEGWSHDGRWLLYVSGAENAREIYALPMTPDGKPAGEPRLIPSRGGRKDEPQLSWDEKYIAYTSDESGMYEVYVAPFPAGEPRVPVTKGGAGQPRWRADGRKLYFRSSQDNAIMSVDVQPGARIEVGLPRIETRPVVNAVMTRDATRHQLGVLADGSRFLVRVPPATAALAGRGGGLGNGITVYFAGRGQGLPVTNIRGGGAREAGRGGGPANAALNGLTVVLDWPSGVQPAR